MVQKVTNSSAAPVSATHVVSWCGEAVLEEMTEVVEGIKGISNDTNMADVEQCNTEEDNRAHQEKEKRKNYMVNRCHLLFQKS